MSETWLYQSLSHDERPSSRAAAHAFVDEIRTSWGFCSQTDEEEWSKIPKRLRGQHELLRKRYREGVKGHTSLAAQGMYTTKFRFIHEIVQNADDANYDEETPHLCVTMQDNEIVFQSNEQGLMAKDVAALCNIGQSSKANDHATAGEKGLGFKSVFGIATHVYIESGHWSFSFKHTKDDDGLGMVVPTWVDCGKESSSFVPGTKLTLEYTAPTTDFRSNLRTALLEICPDFFIALRKLQKITLVMESCATAKSTRIFERLCDKDDTSIKIRSIIDNEEFITKFLIFNTKLADMPTSSFRTQDTTRFMIAFQVDDYDYPQSPSNGHYVYATLPVRRVAGLRFIVQADFTLLPSRENLNDSEWNQRIISALPDAFAYAVSSWSRHDTLKYEWLQFLPGSLDGAEDLWKSLRQNVLVSFAQRPIIESRSTAALRCPRDVRLIPKSFTCDDEPLFQDLPGQDLYISDRYDESHFKSLKEIGVHKLSTEEMHQRIVADAISKNPRLRQPPLRDDWHMTFLELVDNLSSEQHIKNLLGDLPIIPLSNGNWCSPKSTAKIYLPYVELDDGRRSEIPGNLSLQKLNPAACSDHDPDFERLYCNLGVERCTAEEVVSDIVKAHRSWLNRADSTLSAGRISGTLNDRILHHEILFWQGHSSSTKHFTRLAASNQWGEVVSCEHLYFQSEDPYTAFTMLKDAITSDCTETAGYGFLHTRYEESRMQQHMRHGKSWKAWLEQVAGIRYYPPLLQATQSLHPSDQKLHPHLRYVALHRSQDFIGMLHAHWETSYQSLYKRQYTKVAEQISGTKVPTACSDNQEIQKSILPTEEIQTLARKYSVSDHLPLLKLPHAVTKNDKDKWKFLQQFGVLCDVDKVLLIELLKRLKQTNHDAASLKQYSLEIYAKLITECTLDHVEWLKKTLGDHCGVFLPTRTIEGLQWIALEKCVWNGPSALNSKIVLRSQYPSDSIAEKFFQNLLRLPDATCTDIVDDLIEYSVRQDDSELMLDTCKELYSFLALLMENEANANVIEATRSMFDKTALIYASGRWHMSSSCNWNGRLSTRQSLEASYPTLRSFFVDYLGIEVVTTKVVLNDLFKASTQGSADKDTFKNLIVDLSETLYTVGAHEVIMDNSKELRKCKFLPLRNSPTPLARIGDEFLIIDNQRLGSLFEGRLRVLDLTPEQLTIAEPLLQLLHLGGRYLSKRVERQFHAEDQQLDEKLTDHIRYRAYTLSRCAIAHRSLRYIRQNAAAYNMISSCKVYTCRQSQMRLIVNQCQLKIEVPDNRPAIDLQENDGMLSIFVPHDVEALFSCIRTDLPRKLMQHLGIQSTDAERQLYRILCENDEKLDDILEQEDLPHVPWLQPPPPRPSTVLAPGVNGHYTRPEHVVVTRVGAGVQPATFGGTNLLRRFVDDNCYEMFLSKIVIPQAKVNGEVDLGPLSSSGMAQLGPTKIGAAGELFVFERMRSLSLPQFSEDNWKSCIRSLVNVLPEYDFHTWGVTEVADFEYVDTSGEFGTFVEENGIRDYHESDSSESLSVRFNRLKLQCNGPANNSSSDSDVEQQHRKSDNARGARNIPASSQKPIKYLIEVKSTPGPCETPFFVSTRQYDYMGEHRIRSRKHPHTVYVIIRVYDLFSANIKFKIFVDPWRLRKSGVLQFTTDGWKVTESRNGLQNGNSLE